MKQYTCCANYIAEALEKINEMEPKERAKFILKLLPQDEIKKALERLQNENQRNNSI